MASTAVELMRRRMMGARGSSVDWESMYNGLCLQTISGDVVLPNGITKIRYGLFYRCTELTGLTIPSSVTVIEAYAFQECSGLTGTLVIPNTVTTINQSAFYKCTGLTSVTFGSGLTTITTTVFSGCASLAGVITIPNNVTTIGNQAFRDCFRVSAFDIGTGLNKIDAMALYGCSGLNYVIIRATTPPTLGNANAFTSTNNCPIYVPDNSVAAYKAANNWSSLASRIFPISDMPTT